MLCVINRFHIRKFKWVPCLSDSYIENWNQNTRHRVNLINFKEMGQISISISCFVFLNISIYIVVISNKSSSINFIQAKKKNTKAFSLQRSWTIPLFPAEEQLSKQLIASLNGIWRDILPSTIIAGPLLRGFPAAWFPWCDGGGGGAWSGCIQRKPESKKVCNWFSIIRALVYHRAFI